MDGRDYQIMKILCIPSDKKREEKKRNYAYHSPSYDFLIPSSAY